MPFASEKQRKYMWARHPEIARKWTKEHGSTPKKKEASMLSETMVTSLLDELGKLKEAGDMPPFTKQDRPSKVKEIYRALKRDQPDMPAEVKARIASRKGKKSPQSRKTPEAGGPKLKAPLHHKRVKGQYVLKKK